MSVVIETTLGDITVDLYTKDRPRACLNFLKLCKIKYYNYNLFHTISRGFIAQTGDPTGSRKGGESIFGVLEGPEKRYFEGEIKPRMKHTTLGKLSFVGNEENMIGSQFFVTLGEDLMYLDDKHCIFGEVVEGFDILEIINEVICDKDDRPYQDVRITHTVVLDDPFPDLKDMTIPSRSPSPSADRLKGGRIAPDEDVDETLGKSSKEIAEMQAEREAQARATILEMIGDIPDAEMAPPENVLFVCKLNPVTTDDDLEIIFSRFGKIKSCEVIRDRKSGDSLQYAFIEFEERKSCEEAYFKMDNVLIDDRRIHVDFSQSVSKVKWLGKGRGVAHFDDKGKKRNDNGFNNEIGKGNYKIKNGNRRNRSRTPEISHKRRNISSKSPVRNRNRDERYYKNRDREQSNYYSRDRYKDKERDNKRYETKNYHRRHSPHYDSRTKLTDKRKPHEEINRKNKQQESNKNKKIERNRSPSPKQKDTNKNLKKTSKRRKQSSSSSESETSDSDSSSSDTSSSSSSSEEDRKRKKKNKIKNKKPIKKNRDSSSSEDKKSKRKKKRRDSSSDSDRKVKASRKKKKRRSSTESSD